MIDICLSVWMPSNFATPPTVFVLFSRYFAHMIHVPVRKRPWNRFSKFSFYNFWRIFQILTQLRSYRPTVIGNGNIRKFSYGFLFAFHSNYGRIFNRFGTIHERDRQRHRHPARHRTTAYVALMHSIARQKNQRWLRVRSFYILPGCRNAGAVASDGNWAQH